MRLSSVGAVRDRCASHLFRGDRPSWRLLQQINVQDVQQKRHVIMCESLNEFMPEAFCCSFISEEFCPCKRSSSWQKKQQSSIHLRGTDKTQEAELTNWDHCVLPSAPSCETHPFVQKDCSGWVLLWWCFWKVYIKGDFLEIFYFIKKTHTHK